MYYKTKPTGLNGDTKRLPTNNEAFACILMHMLRLRPEKLQVKKKKILFKNSTINYVKFFVSMAEYMQVSYIS